ncbi:efflux RND transporter periplasmic adaptor subunit [Herbiconiux daphne]|uniref:Biotin/lipoyl-binding protein n=1 Tax=Herbiconiux daphne TaxID=2970914 RepID=A0ABT2H456_9MICO|nr:biotin/lipoyl-binding protein [Herbiconiux daphne]MCS5734697.1 biotin/lipoyl-binding protein [Herbiconiux daphne]
MKLAAFVTRIRLRTWIICGAAALVVVGGGATWAALAFSSSSAQAQTAPTAMSVAASLQTLQKTVDATGTLAPTVQQDVDFAVAGTVTAVNVAAGSTVTAGDVLATVDTLTVQADLLEAQATLASAAAKLSSAQADDDGSDASATQIAADAASVAVAQAAADKAAAAVADTTLTAPVAGLVTAVNLEVGDTTTGSGSASGSSASGSGSAGDSASGASGSDTSTAQFTIVSTDSWQVSVSVGETDVPQVAAGDQVELSTDDGTAFFGTVSEVGLLPSTDSGAATYPVTVAVTGSPDGLHDGVSVTASIVYERRTDVLTVPSAAVTTDADGATSVTVVDADGNETVKSVTVGETVGTLTEITDGLAEGDLVQVTVFTPGGGGSGTGGAGGTGTGTGTGTGGQQGGTGTFPGGGTPPDGFDPTQLGGTGTGTGPGGTGTGGFGGVTNGG